MDGVPEEDYSELEELFLAHPLPVTGICCDYSGCLLDGELLIPGAAFCSAHADECGIVSGGLYHVDDDVLVGGAEWRAARENEYLDLLRELRANDPESARRTGRRDRALDLLISRRIRGLVALIEREALP